MAERKFSVYDSEADELRLKLESSIKNEKALSQRYDYTQTKLIVGTSLFTYHSFPIALKSNCRSGCHQVLLISLVMLLPKRSQ